jgi:hypothetical protein
MMTLFQVKQVILEAVNEDDVRQQLIDAANGQGRFALEIEPIKHMKLSLEPIEEYEPKHSDGDVSTKDEAAEIASRKLGEFTGAEVPTMGFDTSKEPAEEVAAKKPAPKPKAKPKAKAKTTKKSK